MNRKLVQYLIAGAIVISAIPFSVSAEETHNVVIMDFNGDVMQTLTVPHGSVLDLSGIDTSVLGSHPDIYTQIAFNSWGNLPKDNIVTEDIVVRALFRRMVIACDKFPEKTEYFSNTGRINLDGLEVTITDYVQTPEKDKNGDFIIKEEVTNIASKCSTIPATLDEAFADKKTSATIEVYPINSEIPIISYDITYFKDFGDVNLDGAVEATDASLILAYYADISVGRPVAMDEYQILCGDVDRNGVTDANDASKILTYYSELSISEGKLTWDDFLDK